MRRPRPLTSAGLKVRSLARTLNAMQDRIAGLVSDRTRTFSALAHDLRTGMTRLRLRIEGGQPEMLDMLSRTSTR